MKCNQCGTEFEGNFCPECGAKAETASQAAPPPIQQQEHQTDQQTTPVQPPKDKKRKKKKPFFLNWWFILIVIIAIAAIAGKLRGSGDKIKWNAMELGNMIPEPPSVRGTLYENSDEQLRVSLENVSDKQYNDYLDACIEKGFTVDPEKDSYSYKAYNADGYCLDMSHINESLSINLEIPMALGTITWPSSAAGKQLPVPESKTGKFSFEYDDNFFVYIGDMSKTDYDAYVAACSDMGFTVDYNKGDTYYYADNSDGWHVSLKYEGNSIMSINIDAPDEEESSKATETDEITKPEKTAESAPSETTDDKQDNNSAGLSPDFKAAMDSYEAFMDEYIAFLKKYNSNPSDPDLLSDYTAYMSKYADFVKDFENWEDEDMNADETAYYLEVQSRVTQKLLEVSG